MNALGAMRIALLASALAGGTSAAEVTGTVLPSGDTANAGWRPRSGSVHYAMVNDASCNGTVNYNYTDQTGRRDAYRFALAAVPDGARITALTVTPCASRHSTGSGVPVMSAFYRWSGGPVSANFGTWSLAALSNVPANLPPATIGSLDLVKSATSTLDVGAIYVSGNRGVRLSRLAVEATYVPLVAPSGLTATPSGNSITLAWLDNTTIETGYQVERSLDGVVYVPLATLPADTRTYTQDGLSNGVYAYRVRATNSGGATAWSNVATANIAVSALASVTAIAGNVQSAQVGTPVAIPPAVVARDASGNPMANVAVNFAVVAGGGMVTAPTAVTGANGTAAVGSWTLGPTPGANRLAARVTGMPDVLFDATAIAVPTGTLVVPVGVNNQTATVGTPVTAAPAVVVRSPTGSPVAGVTVSFQVTLGGGSLQRTSAVSDSGGFASAISWTLGTTAGPQSVQVAASGYGPVVINATAASSGTPALTRTAFMSGLQNPWDIAFTPDGAMLFSERSRGLSLRLANGTRRAIFRPADLAVGEQCGMNGIALDPDFATNRTVYAFVSVAVSTRVESRVIAFDLDATYSTATNRRNIVTGIPHYSGLHCGGRLRFGPDGYLYITTGDTHQGTLPQGVASLGGKVLRVTRTGAAAPGNNTIAGADPRIYTYGHRNPQGIGFRPGTGQAYASEHGPGYSDELTPLAAGGNGGWEPYCAEGSPWGIQYCGYSGEVPMTDTVRFPAAMIPAWTTGNSSEGMSGGTFVTGAQWRDWNGAFVAALLAGKRLEVIRLSADGRTGTSTPMYESLGIRLRTAVQGPDGALYVPTNDESAGDQIWRIAPN